MSKSLLLADLHLHHLPKWRYEWCSEFIMKMLAKYGNNKEQQTHLYLLGDVLEIRDKVDSRVLNMLIKLIKNWCGGDVVWLSGQHDSYIPGKATLHELTDIKLENGVVYVVDNKAFKHDGNWFVPFQRRLEDYRECLNQVPDGVTVLTHIPTKEIIEMYGAKDVEGISVKEFSRFKQTISGDIHKFYDFPTLSYVGAPSQRDWRDKGVDGQIGWLVDGKFMREPTIHPKHIEIYSADEIPKEGEYIIKTKRGSNISAKNVLSVVETSNIDIESVDFKQPQLESEQLGLYLKENSPPCSVTQAREYALEILHNLNK